jgi:hypothetical protein
MGRRRRRKVLRAGQLAVRTYLSSVLTRVWRLRQRLYAWIASAYFVQRHRLVRLHYFLKFHGRSTCALVHLWTRFFL